jgi:tetratricopeptide (TPR) repeat protein
MPDRRSTDAQSLAPSAVGERVRQLRIARGLTQAEVARDKFTKEYVSQIERGRARPTPRTLDWLAERLGVERAFLETGTSSEDTDRAAGLVVRAEAAVAGADYEEALSCLGLAGSPERMPPELGLRALLAHAGARTARGELEAALEILARARDLAEGPEFDDVDRARVVFGLGRCRYKLSSVTTAIALFGEALELMRRSAVADDRLVSNILRWRSRCYRRQRDWQAAREDVERALELAVALDDGREMAHAYFQASIVAERDGKWILARSYAERAMALYEEQDDRRNVGRMLNNLGAINFLLGKSEKAEELLVSAVGVAIETGSVVDEAQAVSSLAQVHLRAGEWERAETEAGRALELLAGRVDYLDEIGNAQLVLGRALLAQERLDGAEHAFSAAESTFDQLSSGSHRAAAWTAQAELALARGDSERALSLYRKAAETLQDFRF